MVMEDRATRFGLERRTFLGCIAVLQIDGADPRYPDQFREVGQSDRPVRAGTPCDPSRRLARLLGVSSSILKRRPQWRCGFTCYLSRQPHALRLREIEPGREQGGGWMSGRMFPPFATTDPRGDGMMHTVTAPGGSARTFLIHMFRRGLDDNRYVVERYKSTFDGEIVRWPCKGKSKTGKQPRQVMSLGAVQRMRPERDEIIVCTGVKITGSGIQYWGSYAVWGHMLRR